MTSKVDVVRRWQAETYTNPPASYRESPMKYMAENFQSLDKDGNVIGNRAAYIATSQAVLAAFTNFKGVVHDIYEEGDGVIMAFHFEGTHTGSLDLSVMGLGVIPPTGKRMKTGEGKTRFMVEGDRIVSSQPISGGFEDVLVAIGAIPASA